ncbi:MAG: filamentous hemagglutinin N-terminal domain-containing protein [Geminicoccaceae bacterium]
MNFMRALHHRLFSTVSLSAVFLSSAAYGLPQNGSVAAGSATITTSGASAVVTQGSDRAVIDWQSFDVGAGEAVTFRQPAASSVTLNRIHDQKPSEIFGRISANGQVILSNPNGMIFGAGSRVDVAGLVATSAGIGKDAFMQGGRLAFDRGGNPAAKIINRGMLTARDTGLIALVAPSVENTGILTATLGRVQLAGAETATLDLYGDGLVSIAVSGNARVTEVTNRGRITGRRIMLTAADAAHLVESVVNATGVLEARDARTEQNGGVVFGGTIEATARDVTLGEGATLRADGRNGGGAIKIGGGWQGRGTIPNAKNTTIAEGAVITANATDKGNGGTIVAWSDGATRFEGRIEAKGGLRGGDGGNVETSGKEHLGVSGSVDASAIRGKTGEWLLDPQNVTISGSGANSVPGTGGTYDPSGATNPYTILDSSISTALSNGNNVTITTTNAGQAQTGNITLSGATIAKTGGGDATLTLKADDSIITSGTNSITSNTGKLHTVFWSDAEAVPNTDGAISLSNTTITTNGGDLILGGGLDDGADIISSVDSTTILFDGIAGDGRPDNYARGNSALDDGIGINGTSSINTGAGNIIARGHGWNNGAGTSQNGVQIQRDLTTDAGNIILSGIGGNGDTNNMGVYIANSAGKLNSTTGTITLNGTGGNGGTQGQKGIYIALGASVNSLGTGISASKINIYGSGGTSSGCCNEGVQIQHAASINTIDGDINITGKSTFSTYGALMLDPATTGPIGILSSGAANITLTGIASISSDIYIRNSTAASHVNIIGGTSNTGTITFNANQINSGTQTPTIQTQGNIVFKPRTNNIGIGISGGGGTLQLSDSFLAGINPDVDGNGVGSLIIGDKDAGTGTVDINGWDLSGKTYDVGVYGGTVDLTGGPIAWNGGNDLTLYSHTGGFVIDQNFTRSAGTAGDGTLTIKAAGNIATSGTRIISAATSGATGKLHTILWSDADPAGPDSNGPIILNSTTITSNGGDIVIGGGLDSGTNGGIASDGRPDGYAKGAAAATGSGISISGSNINAGNGSIILLGSGSENSACSNNCRGISASSTAFATSSNGNISLYGVGGGAGASTNIVGIQIFNGATFSSAAGSIYFTGSVGLAGATNSGVVLGPSVISTITGDVLIRAEKGFSWYNNTTNAIINSGDDIEIILDAEFGATSTASDLNLNAVDTITIKPDTADTTVNVAATVGELFIEAQFLDRFSASNIVIGDATSGLITVNPYATWASRASSGVSFLSGAGGITFAAGAHDFGTKSLAATTGGAVAVNGTVTAGSALLRATGAASDITIGAAGGITASGAGDALTLAAGRNFINNRGAAGLAASGSGRWLVYSTDTTGTVGEETLANAFNRYSCTYGGSCPAPGTGNGLLYHFTPTLTATPAAQNVVYGNAASLAGYGYSVSGYLNALDSAGDSVTGSLTGTSAYAPGSAVGTYGITHASGTLTSAIGYGLAYGNNTTAIGVTPRPLTITADSATRTFGSADPAFTYTVGNLYGADSPSLVSGVTFSTPAILTSPAGSYALTPAGGSVASGNYTLSLYVPGTLTVTPTGDGSHGGATPPPPAPTPPSPGDPGDGGPVLPPVSVIPAGLLDLIRSTDSAAHLQVDMPLRDEWTKIDDRYALDLSLSERDLSEEMPPAGTRKDADTRLSAEERRRRWLGRPLYALSPELASELAGGWEE